MITNPRSSPRKRLLQSEFSNTIMLKEESGIISRTEIDG